MQVEPHDWTVPTPLRALLWWPPVAFLVVLLDPTAAAGKIAIVGAALAVVGVLGAPIGGVFARKLTGQGIDDAEPANAPMALDTTERTVSMSAEQRAA